MSKKMPVAARPSERHAIAQSASSPRHIKPAAWADTKASRKEHNAAEQAEQHDAPADNTLDRLLHSSLARLTGGLSPAALGAAYFDWATHLAFSPHKQLELGQKAARQWLRWMIQAQKEGLSGDVPPCIEPLPTDRRFAGDAWRQWPFSLIYQGFLLNQQWWHNATTGVGGVEPQHQAIVEFATRQLLDTASPSNFPAMNPEALTQTISRGGANLVAGFGNFVEDVRRNLAGEKPVGAEAFEVGRNVAVTPGQASTATA
jgi:poly[(R)-3-hydroxyalkanoate] polymerase subunit PhaC